jgi:hypothetical protein
MNTGMLIAQYGMLLYIGFAILLALSPIIIIIQLAVIASRLREIARRLPPLQRRP